MFKMPLVVVVGMPCSGKSRRALEIKEYLEKEHSKSVSIVSEEELMDKENLTRDQLYSDSKKEMGLRSALTAQIQRDLEKYNVVIVDAMNNIGGFRYELYCLAKSGKQTQCTVECVAPLETMREVNEMRPPEEAYSRETLESLALRYEVPDEKLRWDRPLVRSIWGNEFNFPELARNLFSDRPPHQNKSTKAVPASNFLYKMDQVTSDIIKEIVNTTATDDGDDIRINIYGGHSISNVPHDITPLHLTRYKRQFLSYARLHPPQQNTTLDDLASLFVVYLNANFLPSSSNSHQ